jgi:copper chaperone CopZ
MLRRTFRVLPQRAFIEPAVSVDRVTASGDAAAAVLRVEGLLCSLCATNVRNRLQAIAGVHEAQVSLSDGEAIVRFDGGRVHTDTLVSAIEAAIVLRPVRRWFAKLGASTA